MKARNPSTGNLETVYVKALDSLPVGVILSFPTTSSAELPNGYMFCDGSAISRTTYSELFSLIGTSYGSGDGSTTFNLPNLKGKVQVGIDNNDTDFDTIGETGGGKTHTHQYGLNYTSYYQDIILERNADAGILNYDSSGNKTPVGGGTTWKTSGNYTANAGNLDGTKAVSGSYTYQQTANTEYKSNLQPYTITNFIIKVKQTVALAGKVVNVPSESTTDAYSCDYVNDCNTYLTDEVFTGKYWIDGKPIYRKIINFGALPNNAEALVAHGISNLERIIDLKGISKYPTNNLYFSLPFGGISADANIWLYADNTNVTIGTGRNRTNFTETYVILEYTKSTD